MFKTVKDVAREFRRRYRRDPDPEVWDLAADWRWIDDVIDEPAEANSVFDRIREIEDLRRQPRAGVGRLAHAARDQRGGGAGE